jgi:hypothetical protein
LGALSGIQYISEICQRTRRKRAHFGHSIVGNTTYAALHPEVEGLNPEDYPDINKLSILADVAPYSREYNRIRAVVDKQSHGDLELRSRYEQIVEQVRQTKESTLQVDQRRFDAPVDKIEGTIKSASFHGVELSEYPGRVFHFSAVGSSMADLVADQLGKSNQMTRAQAAGIADNKLRERDNYLATALAEGTRVNLTVARGAADNSHLHRRTFRLLALRRNRVPHRLPHHASMHAQLPRHTDHRPNAKLILPANLLV